MKTVDVETGEIQQATSVVASGLSPFQMITPHTGIFLNKESQIVAHRLTDETALILPQVDNAVMNFSVAADGQTVVAVTRSSTLEVLNIAMKTFILRKDHPLSVQTVVWVDQKNLAALYSTDWSVWDVTQQSICQPVNDFAYATIYRPSRSQLITAVIDIRIWDIKTHERLRTISLPPGEVIHDLALSPNERYLVSLGETISLWDLEAETPLLVSMPNNDGAYALAWSRDGKYIATQTQIYDAQTLAPLQMIGPLVTLTWGPDDKFLIGSHVFPLQIIDIKNGKVIETLSLRDSAISALALSQDERVVAVGFYDGAIGIYDAQTWTEMDLLISHEQSIASLAWSEDDTQIAAGSGDGTVTIWRRE